MLTERVLRSSLRRYWKLDDVSIAVHNGGMGSATWFIGHGSGRWVAKAVPAEAGSQFRGEPDMTGVEVLRQVGVTSSPGEASRRLP